MIKNIIFYLIQIWRIRRAYSPHRHRRYLSLAVPAAGIARGLDGRRPAAPLLRRRCQVGAHAKISGRHSRLDGGRRPGERRQILAVRSTKDDAVPARRARPVSQLQTRRQRSSRESCQIFAGKSAKVWRRKCGKRRRKSAVLRRPAAAGAGFTYRQPGSTTTGTSKTLSPSHSVFDLFFFSFLLLCKFINIQ